MFMKPAGPLDPCVSLQAAIRALGGELSIFDEPITADLLSGCAGGVRGAAAPWQRDTWPSVLSREVAAVLDGLVSRSKYV